MESFIAAHLGEGGGGGWRGSRGIQQQQIHSSILAPTSPPYTITRSSIRSCLSSSTLNLILVTAPTHRSHKAVHVCTCLPILTITLHLYFSGPGPLYVFDGPIHVVYDVVDSTPPPTQPHLAPQAALLLSPHPPVAACPLE